MQIARGVPATLTIETRDFDGELAAPTGSVAVVFRDSDGASVGSGNATLDSTGVYKFTIPATVTGTLGEYTATATYTISGAPHSRSYAVEVIGAYLFDIHELRALERDLADPADYPAEAIRQARESATETLETAAGVAFSPRVSRATIEGDDSPRLLLPDLGVTAVLGVWLDDGDTLTEVEDFTAYGDTGMVVRTDGLPWAAGSSYLVEYEHGYAVTPEPIRRAAMVLAVEALVPSALPARATSQSTDLGNFRISTANPDAGRDTGIPEVDAAITRYGRKRPRVL